MGPWTLILTMLAMLAGAVWVAYEGWISHGDVDTPASLDFALVLMVIATLVVGCGLMALVFYSSRKGYDDLPGASSFKDDSPPAP